MLAADPIEVRLALRRFLVHIYDIGETHLREHRMIGRSEPL